MEPLDARRGGGVASTRVEERATLDARRGRTAGVFEDAIPFLRWARDRKIVTGIVSNADERYGDAILPMLDLSDHVRGGVVSAQ